MANSNNSVLTDKMLACFFANVMSHYNDCRARFGEDMLSIYDEMYLSMEHALYNRHGEYFPLLLSEKQKLRNAFNTIFSALPIFKNKPYFQEQFRQHRPPLYIINHACDGSMYRTYNSSDRFLFNYLLWSSILDSNHGAGYRRGGGGFHGHTGSFGGNNDKDQAKVWAILAVAAIVLSAAMAAGIAAYYVLHQISDSNSRLYYNEGWLKAVITWSSALGFAMASAFAADAFLSGPLMALAITAGLNPVGVAVLVTGLITIIGAGIGVYAMEALRGTISERINPDALDSKDAQRFRLTHTEEVNLIANGLDPIKVKCALVALRAEMSNITHNESGNFSFYSRLFGNVSSTQKTQLKAIIDNVRRLRAGELSEVEVGQFLFSCKAPEPAYNPAHNPGPVPQYVPANLSNPF